MNYRGWKFIEVWNGMKWTRRAGVGLFRNPGMAISVALDLEYRRGIPARVRVIR